MTVGARLLLARRPVYWVSGRKVHLIFFWLLEGGLSSLSVQSVLRLCCFGPLSFSLPRVLLPLPKTFVELRLPLDFVENKNH